MAAETDNQSGSSTSDAAPQPAGIIDTEEAISVPVMDEKDSSIPSEIEYEEDDGVSASSVLLFHENVDQTSQQSCEDPLSDPLALDDSLNGSLSRDLRDLDSTSTDGQIIIVDVNRLKNTELHLKDDNMMNTPCSGASETEADENFTKQMLGIEETAIEEGVRSDGSDSGLGLELAGNVSSSSIRPTVCEYPSLYNCFMHI